MFLGAEWYIWLISFTLVILGFRHISRKCDRERLDSLRKIWDGDEEQIVRIIGQHKYNRLRKVSGELK